MSTKDQEREKVVETVSFTKGSGVSTKDQERKLWKLLVLDRDQVYQLKREREREMCIQL